MYVLSMETERVRGNPPGHTNQYVAGNIRAARQAIGMDLRTMSKLLTDAGRKLSPSGISKLEAGDRRVDVDDLTVIAYLLRTTPAALLTPPDAASGVTGVPGEYLPEEIEKWMQGWLTLTPEGLLTYWQQEWFACQNRIQYYESSLSIPGSDQLPSTETYMQRLAEQRERARFIRVRGEQIDPSGRVFSGPDFLDRLAPGSTE